jgi:hypothetical protein
LIGHIHLYGLQQPGPAATAYRAVLEHCQEPGYRTLAQEGLLQAAQPTAPVASAPLAAATDQPPPRGWRRCGPPPTSAPPLGPMPRLRRRRPPPSNNKPPIPTTRGCCWWSCRDGPANWTSPNGQPAAAERRYHSLACMRSLSGGGP